MTSPISNWLSECPCVAPTGIYSEPQGFIWNSNLLRGLSNSESLSETINKNACAFVIGLFFTRRPATIRRIVIAIIIDPVYRMRWCGLGSHVRQEQGKVIPTITYRDSAFSIIAIARGCFLMATGAHRKPCFVFGSFPRMASCASMRNVFFRTCSAFIASARLSAAALQVALIANRCVSAFAFTNPILAFAGFADWGSVQNYKLAKLATNSNHNGNSNTPRVQV